MSATPADTVQPHFEIQKIYLRDASLECPNSPGLFLEQQWQPEANLQLSSKSEKLDEDNFEVVLTVTLTVKTGKGTAYLVEVHQAGVFLIKNFPEEQMDPLMGIGCPNVLFPFAREAVADLIQKAGFPQHLLPPVNFEAIYAQQMQGSEAPAAEPQKAPH